MKYLSIFVCNNSQKLTFPLKCQHCIFKKKTLFRKSFNFCKKSSHFQLTTHPNFRENKSAVAAILQPTCGIVWFNTLLIDEKFVKIWTAALRADFYDQDWVVRTFLPSLISSHVVEWSQHFKAVIWSHRLGK